MICTICGSRLKVIETRPYHNQTARRYLCRKCNINYYTIEKMSEREAVNQLIKQSVCTNYSNSNKSRENIT